MSANPSARTDPAGHAAAGGRGIHQSGCDDCGALWETGASPRCIDGSLPPGPRKPYIGPFALFLLTNVLFVAMEVLPGSNIFSTPLDQHLHNQPWSPLAQELVAHRLQEKGTTLDAYAPVFNQAVANNAQSLVILMVLPFALLLPVLFRKSRMPFAVHLAFSLHFHAFLLLLISAALLIPAIDLWFGGAGLASQALDNGIAIGSLLISAVYLYLSAGRVYGGSGIARIFKAAVLARRRRPVSSWATASCCCWSRCTRPDIYR